MASRNSRSASAPRDSASDSAAPDDVREAGGSKTRREYRPSTTTNGRAFINSLTRNFRGEHDTLYFAKVGLLTGREFVPGEGNKGYFRDRVQFLDLLVGAPLRSFFEKQFAAAQLDSDEVGRVTIDKTTAGYSLDGVLLEVEIHDLHFTSEVSEREPDHPRAYTKTEGGILMAIALRPFEGG